jgi:transcriptional regulator with XRE-family HTH domain
MIADSLAQRIRLSRKDLRLTQQQLALKAGVSRSYIGNLENGSTNNIGRDIAVALAAALGISLEYLLGVQDDPLYGLPDEDDETEEKAGQKNRRGNQTEDNASNAPYTVIDAEVELLITIYQLLNREKRQILLNMAKVLRDADKPHIIGTDPNQSPSPH